MVINGYLLGSLCGAGITGNLLSVVILRRDKDNKRNSTNWLLQAHAVFDSLYLLARLLTRVFQYLACQQLDSLPAAVDGHLRPSTAISGWLRRTWRPARPSHTWSVSGRWSSSPLTATSPSACPPKSSWGPCDAPRWPSPTSAFCRWSVVCRWGSKVKVTRSMSRSHNVATHLCFVPAHRSRKEGHKVQIWCVHVSVTMCLHSRSFRGQRSKVKVTKPCRYQPACSV